MSNDSLFHCRLTNVLQSAQITTKPTSTVALNAKLSRRKWLLQTQILALTTALLQLLLSLELQIHRLMPVAHLSSGWMRQRPPLDACKNASSQPQKPSHAVSIAEKSTSMEILPTPVRVDRFDARNPSCLLYSGRNKIPGNAFLASDNPAIWCLGGV